MGLLEWLILILVIIWFLGWSFSFGGGIIHILLIVALIIIIYRLFTNRK